MTKMQMYRRVRCEPGKVRKNARKRLHRDVALYLEFVSIARGV